MSNSDFNTCKIILVDMSATFSTDFIKKKVVVPMCYDKIHEMIYELDKQTKNSDL